MDIFLPDIAATALFGRITAGLLSDTPHPPPVFFYGELGVGKTTLISAMVFALPGGSRAETSSPSFTECNIYATTPPVAHFDLYRQEYGAANESLLDFLDGERHVVFVEWSERLPEWALPPERLSCVIDFRGGGRCLRLTATGKRTNFFLTALDAALASHTVFHG